MLANLDAEALMAGPLGAWLEEQAGVREEAAYTSNKRFVMVGAGVLIGGSVLWLAGLLGGPFSFFVGTAASIFASVWAYAPRAKAVERVKLGINQAIAEAVGIRYSPDGDPTEAYVLCKEHSMLPSHNKKRFEDFWEGEVDGRRFRLFEAHLQQETRDSKGRTSTVTKFRGPFLTFGFNRRFLGTTLVQRAGRHKRFLGLGGKKETISVAGKKLDLVDIVHPDFEDTFDVYSDDQVEARYLVHPAYVERMLEVEKSFSGKKLQALFCGGELTVLVEAENMFESGGMDARQDRTKLEKTVAQFSALARLAEALNEPER